MSLQGRTFGAIGVDVGESDHVLSQQVLQEAKSASLRIQPRYSLQMLIFALPIFILVSWLGVDAAGVLGIFVFFLILGVGFSRYRQREILLIPAFTNAAWESIRDKRINAITYSAKNSSDVSTDTFMALVEANRKSASSRAKPAARWELNPREAEYWCAEWMVFWGELSVRVTNYANDGGIDIESSSSIAQVKHYRGIVGVREIRELAGVAATDSEGRRALFFTSGSYSIGAKQFASEANILLYAYDSAKGTCEIVAT